MHAQHPTPTSFTWTEAGLKRGWTPGTGTSLQASEPGVPPAEPVSGHTGGADYSHCCCDCFIIAPCFSIISFVTDFKTVIILVLHIFRLYTGEGPLLLIGGWFTNSSEASEETAACSVLSRAQEREQSSQIHAAASSLASLGRVNQPDPHPRPSPDCLHPISVESSSLIICPCSTIADSASINMHN